MVGIVVLIGMWLCCIGGGVQQVVLIVDVNYVYVCVDWYFMNVLNLF